MRNTPQFGQFLEGVQYVERPGAYVVLANSQGQVAVIDVDGDIHLPGGGIEEGESATDAVRREALEEIGIEVSLGPEIGRANQYGYSAVAEVHFNKRCTYFLAKAVNEDEPGRPAEHKAIWVSSAEARWRLAHESHAWAIQQAEELIAEPHRVSKYSRWQSSLTGPPAVKYVIIAIAGFWGILYLFSIVYPWAVWLFSGE
jgi:8-oxo-dGTP diphosphatase